MSTSNNINQITENCETSFKKELKKFGQELCNPNHYQSDIHQAVVSRDVKKVKSILDKLPPNTIEGLCNIYEYNITIRVAFKDERSDIISLLLNQLPYDENKNKYMKNNSE